MHQGSVITSGVDSEYVLGELSYYLRKTGIDVKEFDFGSSTNDIRQTIREIADKKSVYITSAHSNLSVRVAKNIAPLFAASYPNYLCPLEILPVLGKNFISVYVPHDLLTPYGDTNLQETRFLNVFDHILAPNNAKVLKAAIGGKTQVHEAGWIKYHSEKRGQWQWPETRSLKVVVFVSMIEHLRLKFGVRGLVEYLHPIVREGYIVKLPAWHGVDSIESELKKSGISVVPAEVSSVEVISQSDVVICNGASSIHAESSYLGKPTICMLDEEGISSDSQRQKLMGLHGIFFISRENLKSMTAAEIGRLTRHDFAKPGKVFDFQYVAELIGRHING